MSKQSRLPKASPPNGSSQSSDRGSTSSVGYGRPVRAENVVRFDLVTESPNVGRDVRPAMFLFEPVGLALKSTSRLEAENAALRDQLLVLQRKVRGRAQFTNRAIACSSSSCIVGFEGVRARAPCKCRRDSCLEQMQRHPELNLRRVVLTKPQSD